MEFQRLSLKNAFISVQKEIWATLKIPIDSYHKQ